MIPIHFEEANVTFTKPESMTDEQCMPISAYIGRDLHGIPHILTVWKPNKEDIDAINKGAPIVLSIAGQDLPPISIFTLDENGKPNEL